MKMPVINEHGNIDKKYTLTLSYEMREVCHGETIVSQVTREVSMEYGCYHHHNGFDPEFWRNVLSFQSKSEKLLELARELMKKDIHVEVEYTVAAYEHTAEREVMTATGPMKTTLNQVGFNRWAFESRTAFESDERMLENASDEAGGIYLMPDTRYTKEVNDIWVSWEDGFIKSVAETSHEYEYEI